jgi:transcriptional regulator with XRE-family HTH domain
MTSANLKQPELGRKISELRKAKGMTQEELVEKCNISVRTIQRIETGEVMPRSYTVRTILTALDYDLSQIRDEENESPGILAGIANKLSSGARNLLLINIDLDKPSGFLIRQLHLAWIFGVLYFLLGFFEAAAEYARYDGRSMTMSPVTYAVLKIAVLISFVFFQRGFVMIGGLFKNYLLKITSVILIGLQILLLGYDSVSVFYEAIEREAVLFGASLTYGAIGIIYGVSLRRLDKPLGKVAELAGIFEIAAALFFLTVVLAFVGFIIQIPAELFQIIIIFKVIETIREKERS